ncbi:MAG: NADP transhydrogenase subunit alpha, partial [Promethearchaeota archaeon]
EQGGIQAEGALNGFFPLDCITQDIRLAVKGAEVILIVVPAFAHRQVAQSIAPYLREGQIIILNPGRTFGAVEVLKTIEETRHIRSLFVGEVQTLPFTARELEKHKVQIIKIKDSVNFSVYPIKHLNHVYDMIKGIYPQLNPIYNYLEVTLNNIGMILHPALSLFNASAIEFARQFEFYREGATPQVCKVLENIQFELNEIFKTLGIKQFRFNDWVEQVYGVINRSIYSAIHEIKAYRDLYAPEKLINRYFTEDVPTGLVPISSLATFLNVQTPTIDSIIHLSNILCGCNFSEKGRTIKKLGLVKFISQHLIHQGQRDPVLAGGNSKVLNE